MKLSCLWSVLPLSICLAGIISSLPAQTTKPAPKVEKNWHAPAKKIYAQILLEEVMASRPDLLSLTFHGTPPDTNVHTMFASSWPDRIGNADDEYDIYFTVHAFTAVNPCLTNPALFIVVIPMKDVSGARIGTAIIGFKKPANKVKDEPEYYAEAVAIRNELQAKTQSFAALFRPAP